MSEREGPRGGGGLPANPPRIPGLPSNATFYELWQFKGLNVKAPRTSIDAQEMAWCHNLVPLHDYYLHSIPDNGPAFFNAPTGPTGATGTTGATGPTGPCNITIDGKNAIQDFISPTNNTHVINITTTKPNDILILTVAINAEGEQPGATTPVINSVSGGGLTWTRRASAGGHATNCRAGTGNTSWVLCEVWWALAPSPVTNIPITVLGTSVLGWFQLHVMGVNGIFQTAPWDPHAGLPTIASNLTGPPSLAQVPGVSTANPNNFILFVCCDFTFGTITNAGCGASTPVAPFINVTRTGQSNSFNALDLNLAVDYTTESGTLTAATLSVCSGTVTSWLNIADALQCGG